MISFKAVMAFSFACMAFANSSSAAAVGKRPNVDGRKTAVSTPSAQSVQQLSIAHALVRYGDAWKDPLSLILAARMIKEFGVVPSTAKKLGSASGANEKSSKDRFSVDGVLERARALAGERTDLLAMIDDAAKAGKRGAVNGTQQWRDVVSSRQTDVYRLAFRGGETAMVAVSGDGDSDLDLYVYDENGHLICRDESETDDMVCSWQPRWTGEFTVHIRNLGAANQYVAAHN